MRIDKQTNIIFPNWPSPLNIKACVTTRYQPDAEILPAGRVSTYGDFNLATHVGDESRRVLKNRKQLKGSLNLPSEPVWLNQQHTDIALAINASIVADSPLTADACWTTEKGGVAVVMTADCVPILLTGAQGDIVVAIHAGWQGIYNEIITKTLQQLPKPAGELIAWIGPCISQPYFEVGQELYDKFRGLPAGKVYQAFFKKNPDNRAKYFADLPAMAQMQLEQAGVNQVYQSGLCSYRDSRFYSYRQACHQGDGKTGRMASLIWME